MLHRSQFVACCISARITCYCVRVQQLEISTLAPPYSDALRTRLLMPCALMSCRFSGRFSHATTMAGELPPRDGLHAGRRVADCGRQTRPNELPARWRGTECCPGQAPSFLRVTLLDFSSTAAARVPLQNCDGCVEYSVVATNSLPIAVDET